MLAVVLSVIGLWYWPRGDRRFIGKWSFSTIVMVPGPVEVKGIAQFHRHGILTFTNGNSPRPQSGRWWIEGDELVFEAGLSRNGPPWLVQAASAVETWTGIVLLGGKAAFPIQEVSPNSFRIGSSREGISQFIQFTRLPE